MKKIFFKNPRGLRLVGDIYPADSESIIIMAHGFTGDRKEEGRFDINDVVKAVAVYVEMATWF